VTRARACHALPLNTHPSALAFARPLPAPDPKYDLRWPRRLCLFLHVVTGTLEIVASIAIWFVEDCEYWGYAQGAISIAHALTAAFQIPIVFGQQIIMIPCYSFLVCVKLFLAGLLIAYPCCMMTSLQLYLAHSVYAWVRAGYMVLRMLTLFEGHEYSVSILTAGFINLAGVNPASNVLAVLTVVAYAIFAKLFFSKETFAYQQCENHHTMFEGSYWNNVVAGHHGEGGDDRLRLEQLFHEIDADNDGYITLDEAKDAAVRISNSSMIELMSMYDAKRSVDGKPKTVTFEEFYQLMNIRGAIVTKLEEAQGKKLTDQQKCRLIFDALDLNASGTLSIMELGLILRQFGLPKSEASKVVAMHDTDGDKEIAFDEFYTGFRPLWLFAYTSLKYSMGKRARMVNKVHGRRFFASIVSRQGSLQSLSVVADAVPPTTASKPKR